MAKYRHRIFEMYEFRDEAARALTPKSARTVTKATAPESRTFTHLTVSHSAGVAHVEFSGADSFEEDETANGLGEDFSQLADCLTKDSKVLLDFAGVKTFGTAAIDQLVVLNQKLRTKGSRLALCNLDATVHQSFFNRSSENARQT